MPSTPITGTSGNSYATIASADTYLGDSVRAGLNWSAVDNDTKARSLITATRLLDKQCFIGSKTDTAQTLEWPRTGVTDADGNSVATDTVPDGIINGCIELAYELSQDETLETAQNTGSNDKKYKAGSVEIEFFRPGGVLGTDGLTRFPIVVMEWIREYLCGYGGKGLPSAFGTSDTSQFDDCDTYSLDEPLS
jgi:hypothetical protein